MSQSPNQDRDPYDGDHLDQEQPPVTGEPAVDQALESLQGLESVPLADHHDRLARVHEQLHAALNADDSGRS